MSLMNAKEDRIRTLVAEQAADWFIANREGLAAEEKTRFAAWLKASPMNVEEYLGVALVARDLREACDDPQLSPEALLKRVRAEGVAVAESRLPRIGAVARPAPVRGWQFAAACSRHRECRSVIVARLATRPGASLRRNEHGAL